jgi:CBS domain-containing membrane protein
MMATMRPFHALTAADLMSRDVMIIPRDMSLRAAGHLLSERHVTGAPVVNEKGECIGVLSATDFMHWVGEHGDKPRHHDPGCFHSAWQTGDWDNVPADEVANYMTADPVTVPSGASIIELAQKMTDAHIHRIIVVDGQRRPIGIVSSTDILAAVAYSEFRGA